MYTVIYSQILKESSRALRFHLKRNLLTQVIIYSHQKTLFNFMQPDFGLFLRSALDFFSIVRLYIVTAVHPHVATKT
jgi:hypothetical protein